MNRVLSFLVGIVLGSLVGGTIALLLAPESGEQLRAEMRERAVTLQTEVKQAAVARRAELEQQLASLRSPQQGGGVE
jgi:gas vesicle protein